MESASVPHSMSQKLFAEYEEIINDLKSNFRGKSCLDKSVRARRDRLYHRVQQNLIQLLLDDFEFAAEKDVEALLWRNVFYVCIEEFRTRIRKAAQMKQLTEELKKSADTLKAMIDGASRFYEELLRNFKVIHRLNLDHAQSTDLDPLTASKYLVCYRVYIRLGDLARYHKDLIAHPAQQEWKKATEHYRRALRLNPHNGHAYNQLAVVATYHNDDFRTLYYYFRSIAVARPFETSRENISQLFDRLRKRAEKEKQAQGKVAKNLENLNGRNVKKGKQAQASKKSPITNMKHFTITMLRKFLALHDILYSETNLESFDDTLKSFLNDLTTILDHPESLLTEKVVLDLFEMVIFQIWHIETSSRTLNRDLHSKALTLLFGMLAVVMERSIKVYKARSTQIIAKFTKDKSASEPSKEAEGRGANSTLLYFKSLSVVLSFLGANKDRYLVKPKQEAANGYFLRVREALVSIGNTCIELAGVDITVDPSEFRPPTSEEADMKALIPFQTAFSQLENVDWNLAESTLSGASDRVRRIKLAQFAILCAQLPLESGEPFIAFDRDINRFVMPPQLSQEEFPSLPGAKIEPATPLANEAELDEIFDKALQEMMNERSGNIEDLESGSFDFKDDEDDLGDEVVLVAPSSKPPSSTPAIAQASATPTLPPMDFALPFAPLPNFTPAAFPGPPTSSPSPWGPPASSSIREESRFASMFSKPTATSSSAPSFLASSSYSTPPPGFAQSLPNFPFAPMPVHSNLFPGFLDAPPGVDLSKLGMPQPSTMPFNMPPPGFGAVPETPKPRSIWDFDEAQGSRT